MAAKRWSVLGLLVVAAVLLGGGDRTIHGRGQKYIVPRLVAAGQRIDLAEHTVAGKWTVFDFSSPFCGPCRAMAPRLAELNYRRDDLAVVTVDINRPQVRGIDWESPVARQFRVRSVPTFLIVSPEGRIHCQGDTARAMVESWLRSSGL
jgi:thiol-disulfide isomerase/thioredoxin